MTNDQFFQKINSITKYPSIPTYHQMGDRGVLSKELSNPLPPSTTPLYVTEKINGTNTRILISPDGSDYFIGSREELLYAKGDRIVNESQSIVRTVMNLADSLAKEWAKQSNLCWLVVYGETYGGKIGPCAREYSREDTSFLVFDVLCISKSIVASAMEMTLEEISARRDDRGFGTFVDADLLEEYGKLLGFPTVPYLEQTYSDKMPTSVIGTHDWLRAISDKTRAYFGFNQGPGASEGVIARTANRSFIAKIRHEDYARTVRKMATQFTESK